MLLAFCEGNPLVINGFPSQKTSSTGFDIFFDVSLNKLLNKHASSWLFDSLWHTCESVCKFIAISILFRACKKSEERRHFASQSALEKVGDICRLQEGTSWGMRGGGGVVVVVLWWWDVHEGRPAGVFFGGGCTVVGSWGVWVFARLGAARRGGFWRLRIWWPVSLALHCKSMHGQADWPPFRRFCSVTNFYFSKFFSGGDNNKKEEES